MGSVAYPAGRTLIDRGDADRESEGPDAPPAPEVAPESAAASPSVAPKSASARAVGEQPGRWWYVAVAGLAAVLVAVLVFGTMFGVQVVRGYSDDAAGSAAVAAARQAAGNVTSFSFESAEADLQRLSGTTTPRFDQDFAQDKNAFAATLRDGKVKSSGTPTEAGLVSLDGDTAKVMVAVRASIQTTQLPQPEARDYRMLITMLHQDGKWLADSLEFIP